MFGFRRLCPALIVCSLLDSEFFSDGFFSSSFFFPNISKAAEGHWRWLSLARVELTTSCGVLPMCAFESDVGAASIVADVNDGKKS